MSKVRNEPGPEHPDAPCSSGWLQPVIPGLIVSGHIIRKRGTFTSKPRTNGETEGGTASETENETTGNKHKERPGMPSSKQLKYATALKKLTGMALSNETLATAVGLSSWITKCLAEHPELAEGKIRAMKHKKFRR